MQDTTLHPHVPDDVLDQLHNARCSTCNGEGTVEELNESYSMRQEQWYPNYVPVPCPTCHATGYAGEPLEVAA
jgi:DnaJ-class molecular chaperone